MNLDTIDTDAVHSKPGDDPYMGYHRRIDGPTFEVFKWKDLFYWSDYSSHTGKFGWPAYGPFPSAKGAYRNALTER
jgi:hypothetical protein